jgi:hypothetical protein
MKTCDNCKHWTRGDYHGDIKRDNGNHRGRCANPNFIDANEQESIEPHQLIYWDAEGERCGFATGAKFGCVHFEKVEGE